MKYTNKQIQDLLDGIYDGSITELNLPNDLYLAIAEHLKSGLYKGFGSTLGTVIERDVELLTALRENVYMFSAAKTYNEVKDISSMLIDEEGNLRTSREFNKIGREAYDNWNNNWGETEYNTTVLQAQNSIKWQEIVANKELFPRVKYSTIGDACDICGPLDGLVFDIDDPELDIIAPENHFNCKCLLEQVDEEEPLSENRSEVVDSIDVPDMFRNNAGKTGTVFTKDHPYFEDVNKEMAKNNFNLEIPDNDD